MDNSIDFILLPTLVNYDQNRFITTGQFSSTADWYPKLHEYQQKASNVLLFSFVNPQSMEVPLSFKRLAATRGTDSPGTELKNHFLRKLQTTPTS